MGSRLGRAAFVGLPGKSHWFPSGRTPADSTIPDSRISHAGAFPLYVDVHAINWWVLGSKYSLQVMPSRSTENSSAITLRPTGSCASWITVMPWTSAATAKRAARRLGALLGCCPRRTSRSPEPARESGRSDPAWAPSQLPHPCAPCTRSMAGFVYEGVEKACRADWRRGGRRPRSRRPTWRSLPLWPSSCRGAAPGCSPG